jgi:hypothetical protein
MSNGFELMQIQPLMPCGPIEALNVGILSGLAGLNVDQSYCQIWCMGIKPRSCLIDPVLARRP